MANDREILDLARNGNVFKTDQLESDDALTRRMVMELDCYEYYAPQGKSMITHWWDTLVVPPEAPYSALKTAREQKLEQELIEARSREEVATLRSAMKHPQQLFATEDDEVVEAQAETQDAKARLEEERIASGHVHASRFAPVGSHLRHVPYDIRAHLQSRERRLQE